MNVAIIVAAGSGTRVGGDKPKQFLEVAGKPIIFHTIDKFERCGAIDEIVLVISADQMGNYRELALRFRPRKVGKIVYGGATRAESVQRGLAVIEAPADTVVAVHDAARPFVTPDEISATVAAAREYGAACLVAPVTDTIKQVWAGRIATTIDRAQLRRALTPQAVNIEVLRGAFAAAADALDGVTDECFLLERQGLQVTTVEGSARNFKITTPEDLIVAEAFFATEES